MGFNDLMVWFPPKEKPKPVDNSDDKRPRPTSSHLVPDEVAKAHLTSSRVRISNTDEDEVEDWGQN